MLWKYPAQMKTMRETVFKKFKSEGKNISDPLLELACFRNIPFGHPLKGEFNISLAMMRWPWLYVEKDGIENYWFTRIMRMTVKERRLYLIGSASSGKTMTACVSGSNLWAASPWDTMFVVTSTDTESLDVKAWGALRDLCEKDEFKLGHVLDSEDAIVLKQNAKASRRDMRDAIKAIALPKGSEGRKAIGKVQGRKNQNIIWLRDEYDHMDSFVSEAEDNLMSAPSYAFVSCSNKPEEGGPMWNDAMPNPKEFPLGWETPGLSDKTGWRTANGGYCLYFDGEKSPNTTATTDKDPFERLTTRSYINAIREKGEDSLGWWMYIKAFPKPGMAHDRLITQQVLERYEATEPATWQGSSWVTVCGLDAAWTKGGDDCVADFGRVGLDFRGIKILAHETDGVVLHGKVGQAGTYEEQLSASFLDECAKRECHAVAIDISGSGGRMANAVRNEATKRSYKLEIIAVDSAGAADETETYIIGDVRKTGKEAFDRRVSELWYAYRLDVEAGLIRGVSPTCKAVKELCERRVSMDEKKRFEIEKKEDYKERNKGRSPDNAEARVLLRYAAHKHGLGASVVQRAKNTLESFRSSQEKAPAAYSWTSGKARYGY